MEILLDENIDVRFKYRLAEQIPEHENFLKGNPAAGFYVING